MTPTISKRAAILTAACATAAALLGTVLYWALSGPTTEPHAPAPVSHIDAEQRACLLTQNHADTRTVDTVWTGMRLASMRSHGLIVQRYTVPAHVTPKTYLGTLVQMRCRTVVTVGPGLRNAVASRTVHGSRFVVITDHQVTAPGTTSLTPARATSTAVAAAVTRADN